MGCKLLILVIFVFSATQAKPKPPHIQDPNSVDYWAPEKWDEANQYPGIKGMLKKARISPSQIVLKPLNDTLFELFTKNMTDESGAAQKDLKSLVKEEKGEIE